MFWRCAHWKLLGANSKTKPRKTDLILSISSVSYVRMSFHNFHFAKAAHKRCVDRSVKYIDWVVPGQSNVTSVCFWVVFLSTCATQTHLECNIHAYTLGHNNWPKTVCHLNSMLSMAKCNCRTLAYKSTTILPILVRFTNQNDCKWFAFVFIE